MVHDFAFTLRDVFVKATLGESFLELGETMKEGLVKCHEWEQAVSIQFTHSHAELGVSKLKVNLLWKSPKKLFLRVGFITRAAVNKGEVGERRVMRLGPDEMIILSKE